MLLLDLIRLLNFNARNTILQGGIKVSKEEHIPASLRIPQHIDFDSSLEHIDYNIGQLFNMLNIGVELHPFDVLNYIMPIITNVYRLVEKPARGHEDDTFCLQTRLNSCHSEDIDKLKRELGNIRENDIYQILKDARNHTIAHTHSSYQGYRATANALLEDARCLIKREDCLKKLVKSIQSLIYNVEISVKKKEGKPLNSDSFTIIVSP